MCSPSPGLSTCWSSTPPHRVHVRTQHASAFFFCPWNICSHFLRIRPFVLLVLCLIYCADVSEISKNLSSQAEQFKWSSKKLSLMVSKQFVGRREGSFLFNNREAEWGYQAIGTFLSSMRRCTLSSSWRPMVHNAIQSESLIRIYSFKATARYWPVAIQNILFWLKLLSNNLLSLSSSEFWPPDRQGCGSGPHRNSWSVRRAHVIQKRDSQSHEYLAFVLFLCGEPSPAPHFPPVLRTRLFSSLLKYIFRM